VAGVTEGAIKILTAIPGLELVDLEQPRVGYMCNSLAPVPAYKRERTPASSTRRQPPGVDYLVGIYHACHRELCAHETTSPFKIVNFLELVGEAMGVEKTDLFKQWKMMQDVDRVLAEVAQQATATGLDLENVREVLIAHMLGEQPLPWIFAPHRRLKNPKLRRFGLSRSKLTTFESRVSAEIRHCRVARHDLSLTPITEKLYRTRIQARKVISSFVGFTCCQSSLTALLIALICRARFSAVR
jgi:hypothetical protein